MEYKQTIEQSEYGTIKAVARDYGLNYQTLLAWVNEKNEPNNDNKQKLEQVMQDLRNKPAMQKHPSYGWAFPEQIEKLQSSEFVRSATKS